MSNLFQGIPIKVKLKTSEINKITNNLLRVSNKNGEPHRLYIMDLVDRMRKDQKLLKRELKISGVPKIPKQFSPLVNLPSEDSPLKIIERTENSITFKHQITEQIWQGQIVGDKINTPLLKIAGPNTLPISLIERGENISGAMPRIIDKEIDAYNLF